MLRADDHGVTVGDGVFETHEGGRRRSRSRCAATCAGSRLGRRARAGGRPRRRYAPAVAEVLAADGLDRARLRVTVTGGPSPFGSDRGDAAPTVIVATAPLSDWPATADVAIVPWTRNERAATAGLKTTSYADNVIALRYAHEHGAAEAIFANTVGELCEGTGSNVFVGIGGELVTPPLSSGCLAGITRELVIEWLGDVVERPLPLAALAERRRGVPRLEHPRRAADPRSRRQAAAGGTRPADPHGRSTVFAQRSVGGRPVTVVVSPEPLTPGRRHRGRA